VTVSSQEGPPGRRRVTGGTAHVLGDGEGGDFVAEEAEFGLNPAPAPGGVRFICQVPEGQYDDERRAAVTAAMTQAVAEAEGGAWPHIPARGQ
jgi:hypothetical protein